MLRVGTWFGIGCVLAFSAQSSPAEEGRVPAGNPAPTPCVSLVALAEAAVTGGGNLTGTVMLTAPAPSGGLIINVSSSNPSARVDGQVSAQPGQTSANFAVATAPVATSTSATITAAVGSCSANMGVIVEPAMLAYLTLSANAAKGNSTLTAAVVLNGPAPSGGATVKLQSSDPLVQLPTSVAIPAGEAIAHFPVTTGLPLAPGSVALTATYGMSVQSALLTLHPGI